MAKSSAEKLLHRYIPGATIKVNWSGRRTESLDVDDDGKVTICWRPTSGATTLLHEIGHYRLRHHGNAQLERELIAPTASIVMAEVAAWLWAEKAAWKNRVAFDYLAAEKAFGTYSRQVRVAWRHRPPESARTDNSQSSDGLS